MRKAPRLQKRRGTRGQDRGQGSPEGERVFRLPFWQDLTTFLRANPGHEEFIAMICEPVYDILRAVAELERIWAQTVAKL
jgi:hypothetical protein